MASIDETMMKVRQWYDNDKNCKRFFIDEMKEMWKLYKGDHWDLVGTDGNALRTADQQLNRPNSVENVTFSLVEGIASEFAQDVELIDIPVESGDDKEAILMTHLKKYIFYKNHIVTERVKMLRWYFLYGILIKHVYWDPEWRGGRGPNRWEGDIRWKALHPLCFIPDGRCREDINEGNRCHKIVWTTMESIEQRYPEKANVIQQEIIDEEDLLDNEQEDSEGESYSGNTDEMVPIIETWYKGEPLILDKGEKSQGNGLHVIWWAGEDQGVYLKHTNYIYFDPEETVTFPFVLKTCYPRENTIWGYGEAYFLKNPQIILNKTAEIILEGHLHNAIGQTWYNEAALTEKQRTLIRTKGTLPGMWFPVKDITGIKRIFGQNVPGTLLNEMGRLEKRMEAIIGRYDISQGRTPGSVTAYKAIAELAERAQVRLRIKELTISSAYEEAGMFCNRLIEKYYTERRKFRIVDKESNYEYGVYSKEDMMKVYNYSNGQVSPYKQLGFNPDDLEEEKQVDFKKKNEVYFPEFDCYCKTTSVIPSDKFFQMEMAKELVIAKIIDVETYLHVIKTGKFPPIEEIMRRMKQQEQEALAQQQQLQQQEQQPQQQEGQLQEGQEQIDPNEELIAYLEQLDPQTQNYLASLPEDQVVAAIQELIQAEQQGQAGGGG